MVPSIRPLETARLLLEPLAEPHANGLQFHISDWEVVKYLTARVRWPYQANGAVEFIASTRDRHMKGGVYAWALTNRSAPGEAIGCISLERKDDQWTRGFWLGRLHQGQGLMSEAVIAVTDFGFNELGIDRLEVPTVVGNPASAAIKNKMAGRILRREPVPEVRPGTEFVEQDVWEITAEAWQSWREKD